MSRTIGFLTILGMMVASIIIVWPKLVQIEPEAATSVTRTQVVNGVSGLVAAVSGPLGGCASD